MYIYILMTYLNGIDQLKATDHCFRTSVLCHNTAKVGETFHIVHVLFPNSDWTGSSSSTDLHYFGFLCADLKTNLLGFGF